MFLHQQFEIEVLYSSMLFTSCVSFQPTLNLLHGKPCNAASYSSLESPEVEDQGEEEGGGGGGGRRRTTHRLSQGSLGQCQLWWQRPLVRHHHRKLKQGKKHRYHTWTAVKLMIIQCSRLNMQMKGWSKQLQWHSLNLWHDNEVFILKTHHTPLWCIEPSRSIHSKKQIFLQLFPVSRYYMWLKSSSACKQCLSYFINLAKMDVEFAFYFTYLPFYLWLCTEEAPRNKVKVCKQVWRWSSDGDVC